MGRISASHAGTPTRSPTRVFPSSSTRRFVNLPTQGCSSNCPALSAMLTPASVWPRRMRGSLTAGSSRAATAAYRSCEVNVTSPVLACHVPVSMRGTFGMVTSSGIVLLSLCVPLSGQEEVHDDDQHDGASDADANPDAGVGDGAHGVPSAVTAGGVSGSSGTFGFGRPCVPGLKRGMLYSSRTQASSSSSTVIRP